MALVGLAVFLYPCHGLLKLFLVVDAKVDTAQDLHQVDTLAAQPQIALQEVGVYYAAGNAHTHTAEGEVRLAAHGGHGLGGTGKTKNLLCHVGGDGVVAKVLHIVTVDAEGGKSFLGMGGQHGCQINGTGALRTIESPYSLGVVGIHVHRLRTIAPARGHGDGAAHTLALELICTGGRLGHPADGGVGNDTFHSTAVAIVQVAADQVGHSMGQVHGLLFQTLADTALTTIDDGADANFWIFAHSSFC